MLINLSTVKKSALGLLTALSLVTAAAALAADTASECADAALLDIADTLRGYAADGEVEIFRLDLPAAGVVTVDVATPPVEGNPVQLDLLPGCNRTALGDAILVQQSANHLVLATRTAGSWRLRTTTRHAGRYKVVTGFRRARVRDELFRAEPLSGSEGLHLRRTSFHDAGPGATLLLRLLRLAAASWPHKNEPEVVDPDPSTATAGPGTGFEHGIDRVVYYKGFCDPASREDDHGDTPSCATPIRLGQRVAGEIGNDWDDDVDVFALTLDRVATVDVRLGTAGEGAVGRVAEVAAELDDCSGRRLAADPADPHHPLAITLGPGRYCVRVAGGYAAAGAYSLTVTAQGR